MKAFESRINDLPLEEGASLRDFREIVAAMLTDLEARLPDEYPPKLAALLAFEDGREEGSKYPNFLSLADMVRLRVLQSIVAPSLGL